jgi:hypothetical protein
MKYILKKRDLLEKKNCSYRGLTQTYGKWKTVGKYDTLQEAAISRKSIGFYDRGIFFNGKRIHENEIWKATRKGDMR